MMCTLNTEFISILLTNKIRLAQRTLTKYCFNHIPMGHTIGKGMRTWDSIHRHLLTCVAEQRGPRQTY
jgi:hypothetical protein